MKKPIQTLSLVIIFTSSLSAQNLVPDPSFDGYTSIPCSWTTPDEPLSMYMYFWSTPTGGSSDIYSSESNENCFSYCCGSNDIFSLGTQEPRTGQTMAGFITYGDGCLSGLPNYREYLQVPLTDPLNVGEEYYAEYYISRGDKSYFANNGFGMIVSETLINFNDDCVNLTGYAEPVFMEEEVITDSEEWVKISGSFIASSAAEYIIIGNFLDNEDNLTETFPENDGNSHAYYFVDDVSIIQIGCSSFTQTVTACTGNPLSLSPPTSSNFLFWAEASNPDEVFSEEPILEVFPTVNTSYIAYTNCDTLNVNIVLEDDFLNPIQFGNDTLLCFTSVYNLTAYQVNALQYEWSTGDNNASIVITESGTYAVTVTGPCDSRADSITIDFSEVPSIFLGPDQIICQDEIIELNFDDLSIDLSFLWSNGSTESSLSVTESGTYGLTVSNECGEDSDEIIIRSAEELIIPFPTDTVVCAGEELYLNVYNPDSEYLWSDGSSDSSLLITTPGVYGVTVTNPCTSIEQEISVDFLDVLDFRLPEDTTACQGGFLTLDFSDLDADFLWEDGNTSSVYTFSEEGVYSVTVSDECEELNREVFISFGDCECRAEVPNVFTPNGDSTNDSFFVLNTDEVTVNTLEIYNRWGQRVFTTTDPEIKWDGTYQGNPAPADTYVYILQLKCFEVEKTQGGDLTLIR